MSSQPLQQTPVEGVALSGAAFFENPYPLYAQIAATRAPVFDEASGSWLVAGYADVSALLRDARTSKRVTRAVSTPFEEAILFRDPPDHGRVRAVMNQAFTGPAMERLDQRISQIADRLIDTMIATGTEAGPADFLQSFAVPLPVDVISTILGMPPDERDRVHEWSSQMILDEDVPVAEGQVRQYQAICGMEACIRRLLTEPSVQVQQGLIGALSLPGPAGERLTEDELIGNCILLLVAGHETTVNLLGNGLLLLLERPHLLQALRADARLLSPFLEEVLRYEAPVQQGTFRITTEAIKIGGVEIEAGMPVTALIGAANRDPAIFSEPDQFDPARVPNPHLAFGMGPHRCIGAMLARMEARIAFSRLLARLPNLQFGAAAERADWLSRIRRMMYRPPPPPARWRHNAVTRGLRKLDITY